MLERLCPRCDAVLPTRVGMVRLIPSCSSALSRSPHTRGDGPDYLHDVFSEALCSPHTRGDGPQQGFYPGLFITFSPHAWGWSAINSLDQITMRRSPHTRGDGPRLAIVSA